MKRIALVVLAFTACTITLSSRQAAPVPSGMSAERIARIDARLQRYIDEGQVAGIVARVMRNGQLIYERAFGWSDKESGRRMTTDAIFRIASQSKAITSAVAMMLVEEGKIGLNDPVSRFIPAFAKTTVSVRKDGVVSIVPAVRQITIRQLLSHTSGISYGMEADVAPLYQAKGLGPAAGLGWYTADKDEPICDTMERLATLPMVAQPGAAYVYGYSLDVLGCVIERASGVPLDRFIKTRITDPLGMKDTHFFLPSAERNRLVTVYESGADGKAVRAAEGPKGQGHYVDGPRRNFAGGAGLVSTARDYTRFLEMIRNHGALGSVRLLSPRAVALMTTNQIGTLYSTNGMGFGYGFETTDRIGANNFDGVGAFGWGGAYGSVYRVDPESGIVMSLMINLMPNATDIRTVFPVLVYQSVLDIRPR